MSKRDDPGAGYRWQGDTQTGIDYDQENDMQIDDDTDPAQMEMLCQMQRSAEANKQLVFGTYGNAISILEEFERREMEKFKHGHQMPKSKIPIPNQSHKTFEDIEAIVETQILMFEMQIKACPGDVLENIRDELKLRTICWAAVRAEKDVQGIHKTDYYISQLYEILAKGTTKHTMPKSTDVSKETLKSCAQALMYGTHARDELDDQFKKDRNKKATVPDMRTSELIEKGADRIIKASGNRGQGTDIERDLRDFIQNQPISLK